MSDSPWDIDYTPGARRDLRRLDPQVRTRVVTAIERLGSNDPRADVRRLQGGDEHRLRAGDWRVRFKRDAASHRIVVQRVLPRGRAYNR